MMLFSNQHSCRTLCANPYMDGGEASMRLRATCVRFDVYEDKFDSPINVATAFQCADTVRFLFIVPNLRILPIRGR